MTNIVSIPRRSTRLSPKLRTAIRGMIRDGLSQVAAAEAAGMSRQGLGKAMKRPAVRDAMALEQAMFVAEIADKRAIYRAQAFEVAVKMMLDPKTSDAVRARMVEFLAGDGKTPQVALHIDARPSAGYEYIRPGARVVEIEDPAKG